MEEINYSSTCNQLFVADTLVSLNAKELYIDLYGGDGFTEWYSQIKQDYVKEVDYVLLKGTYTTVPPQPIMVLTADCAKHLVMSAQTVKGKEVRKWLIDNIREATHNPLHPLKET